MWNLLVSHKIFFIEKEASLLYIYAFLLARNIENYAKWMLNSERTFKNKGRVTLDGFYKTLLPSAVTCI